MSGMLVDTSVWIDFFSGQTVNRLEDALKVGQVVLSPVVAAELVSAAQSREARAQILRLVDQLGVQQPPPAHWIRAGDLRRRMRAQGVTVSTPDAHIAQLVLDKDCQLLTRDRVFERIAVTLPLKLA